MSNKHKTIIKLFASAFVLLAAGCGYSDYPGHPGHNTDKEAYVPALSTVISGFGEEYDGSYVYTVRYDNQNWMKNNFKFKAKITGYRNVVTDSYPHRTDIFPDGDGFERATGFAGGKFTRYWTAIDEDPVAEGGLDNFDQSHPLDENGDWISPGLIFIMNVPEQEVDSVDWDLQSTVKNASDLLATLISNGGSLNNLALSVNALELNGQVHNVKPFELLFNSNLGNVQVSLRNQPATQSVVEAILNNTEHLKIVDLKLHFNNGMEVALPKKISLMFNHDVLAKFVK